MPRQVHSMWQLLDGILVGLVAVTPGCATIDPFAAILISGSAVLAYRCGVRLCQHFHVDDVVESFGVHGCAAAWGCVWTGVFSTQLHCDMAYGKGAIDLH